jgi:hypothetical protein
VPAATPLPAASDDSAARKQLEAGWRTRAQRARQSVTDTAARVATLEQQVQQLAGKSLASTDTFEIMRLRQQRESLEAQLKEARAASQKAVEQLGGLEDEARRAGVPPGWIR